MDVKMLLIEVQDPNGFAIDRPPLRGLLIDRAPLGSSKHHVNVTPIVGTLLMGLDRTAA
jgi:hypothetical protein